MVARESYGVVTGLGRIAMSEGIALFKCSPEWEWVSALSLCSMPVGCSPEVIDEHTRILHQTTRVINKHACMFHVRLPL